MLGISALNSDNLAGRFLKAAYQIADFGKLCGIFICPTEDDNLVLFRRLSSLEQLQVVQKIEKSCAIYEEMVQNRENIRHPAAVIWKAVQSFGLRPCSDFFDKVQDGDVIQIFSEDEIHRFSNLKFFEVVSYTLEQVYSQPWPALWERNEEQMNFLSSQVSKAFDPDLLTSYCPEAHVHQVKETSSILRFETSYTLKCISPLFDRHTRARKGFVVCESASVTNLHAPLVEERMIRNHEESLN